MIRSVLAVPAALALVMGGVGTAAVTHAEPPPPCAYTLSPPQVVQVDSTSMVTATVAIGNCVAPPAGPSLNVACVQLQGANSVMHCTQAHGTDAAQVFFAPYQPGATYVATGRGCPSWIGQSIAPLCQILGPETATL
ncbi:hypothetical protein BH09ACT7_BH09ACT7_42870 [soil metagenome]